MTISLPKDVLLRAPTLDDAEAVAALANTCRLAHQGTPPLDAAEIRSSWQTPGFSLATDAWAIVTPDGTLIGYAAVRLLGGGQYSTEGWTHPAREGQGIGTTLVRLAEARARQLLPAAPPQARISIQNSPIDSKNEAAQRLLEQEGYQRVRQGWVMKREMEAAPPAAQWPDGISRRAFIPSQDLYPVYTTFEETFQDHWNFIPTPFEVWEHRIKEEGFDPTLWFLAWAGEELAGAALCRSHAGIAWVDLLGVRRPWRRRGLGLALLRQAFGELYQRGEREVVLAVDTQNLTGAVRLYERAGMRICWQYDIYEKDLRSA